MAPGLRQRCIPRFQDAPPVETGLRVDY
jgi:hypothetical protein